jgi:hypothetical protein
MSDDDNHIIKASFQVIPPEFLARIKEISEAEYLPLDIATLADDVQTIAAVALYNAENVDLIVQLFERMASTGTLKVEKPEERPPKRFES